MLRIIKLLPNLEDKMLCKDNSIKALQEKHGKYYIDKTLKYFLREKAI